MIILINLINKWKSFGWKTLVADGHSDKSLSKAFKKVKFNIHGTPTVILAKTTKGKGVYFLEGHGGWHHKIPTTEDQIKIFKELK